ncbi:MAG TPA: hypothetical protein VFG43_13925, partial [Geminicoccaceae bacterium]|nr:hypothetical protein [Geminicoccaceae bacterium]
MQPRSPVDRAKLREASSEAPAAVAQGPLRPEHMASLRQMVLGIVGDPELAERVLQQALVEQALADLERGGEPRPAAEALNTYTAFARVRRRALEMRAKR